MKTKVMVKSLIILGIIGIISCSSNNDGQNPIDSQCEDSTLIMEITESIPATVKQVDKGQPFYKGIKTFYEIDAENHLPKLFEMNGQKMARFFPVNGLVGKIGDEVSIKGVLSSCLTGDHGLLTNDYKAFLIIETP